jgi:hypothetical protein
MTMTNTIGPAESEHHDDPRANMFGLLPCPKCGGKHRWPTRPDHPKSPNRIVCDDCGYEAAIAPAVEDA